MIFGDAVRSRRAADQFRRPSAAAGKPLMIRTNRFWLAAAVLAALGSARADTYYVVVFGAQSKPQRPRYSHSWATFVHVRGDCADGPPADAAAVEWFTISWMPCKIE